MMADWNRVNDRLRRGLAICLYDFPGREEETDVLFIGTGVSAENVDFLRRHVGGPLAVYVSGDFLARLGVQTFRDFVRAVDACPCLKGVVEKSRSHDLRFAISIDARDNFTGCSPVESAHTINRLFELVRIAGDMSNTELVAQFCERFISPGHVPVIHVAKGLLAERKGHAELSMTIAIKHGLPTLVVAAELTDPRTLQSMRLEAAQEFASRYDMPFVTGEDVVSWFRESGDVGTNVLYRQD